MASTKLVLGVDAGQAQSSIDSMTESLIKMNEQLSEATEAGNWKDAANLTMAMNNLQASQKQMIAMGNADINRQNKDNNSLQVANNAVLVANSASGAVSTLAGGNYAGAIINSTRSAGGTLRSFGKGLEAKEGSEGLGKILSVLGVGGMVAGAVMAGGNALSEQYEKSLTPMHSLNKTFGGMTNLKSAAQNNSQALDFYNQLTEEANKIGMALDEFAEVVVDMAKYGVGDYKQAKTMAASSGKWANFTNSDITQLQNYYGLASRYGDKGDVLSVAYGGLMASGMDKGQYGEFLNSLLKVMEDGIANGYLKTTEEIATNLTMFAKLSGNNEVWKGEQGANRLMKMNQSIAGATGLQSVSDMIIASAAKNVVENMSDTDKLKYFMPEKGVSRETGTYVDYMLLMEQGTNPAMFGQIAKSVQSMESDNVAGQIERYKSIFGVNYTGAVDIYNMANKIGKDGYTEEDFSKEVKKMQTNADYQSDEQKRQSVLNDIHNEVVNIGKKSFDVKIAGLGGIEKTVSSIFSKMVSSDKPHFEYFLDPTSTEGKVIQSVYNSNPKAFAGLQELQYELTADEIDKIKQSRLFYTANIKDWQEHIAGIKEYGVDGYLSQGSMTGDSPFYNAFNTIKGKSKSYYTKYFIDSMQNKDTIAQDNFDNEILQRLYGNFQGSDSLGLFLEDSRTQKWLSNYEVSRINGGTPDMANMLKELEQLIKSWYSGDKKHPGHLDITGGDKIDYSEQIFNLLNSGKFIIDMP